jgi:hypothetical protein
MLGMVLVMATPMYVLAQMLASAVNFVMNLFNGEGRGDGSGYGEG